MQNPLPQPRAAATSRGVTALSRRGEGWEHSAAAPNRAAKGSRPYRSHSHCILASPAYPSSFLPFRFSFGEVRGDALAFQSFTGSLCVDALAPNPPDVEAKLATSSSWSLRRNSRGEDVTRRTGQRWPSLQGRDSHSICTEPESRTAEDAHHPGHYLRGLSKLSACCSVPIQGCVGRA